MGENLPDSGPAPPARLSVCIDPPVWADMERYARADTEHERGGILVGQYHPGPADAGLTYVIGWIQAEYSEASMASVTFTHETWAHFHAERERLFPDAQIVGWFHTHPNFGVFLSNYDRFIQENFFAFPGGVAVVFDPVRSEWGAFFSAPEGCLESCDFGRAKAQPASAPPPVRMRRRIRIAAGVALGCLLLAATMPWLGGWWLRWLAEKQRAEFRPAPVEYIAVRPVAVSQPQPEPEPEQIVVVRPGDSLWQLSQDLYHDGSQFWRLAEANGLTPPYRLEPGQRLLVPPPVER